MSNSESKKILDAVRAVRQLHQDISSLLTEVDAFVNDRDWELFTDNKCFSETSVVFDGYRKWMPRVFFRLYKNESLPHLLAFVSVIIDDEENIQTFNTPLISAGVIDYGIGATIKDYEWCYVKIANWNRSKANKYGCVETVEKSDIIENSYDAESISYIAHPLASITGSLELSELILQPVETLISNKKG